MTSDAPTSKDLGHFEVDISFPNLAEGRATASQTDQTSHAQNARPTDATFVWYHSLRDVEKQIKGLQLHEATNRPPFVVLSMGDANHLRLEMSERITTSVRVTRLSDRDVARLVPSSVQVEFLQECPQVDLKFVIAVCYSVLECVHNPPNKPTSSMRLGDPQRQRLFALALFTSIVRQSLPIGSPLVAGICNLAYFEGLLIESLSSKHAGQHLWEENIVEAVYQEVRRAINTAASDRLKAFMVNNPVNESIDTEEEKEHDAESIVAWLEFAVNKGRFPVSNLWSSEWDKSWASEWIKNWENIGTQEMPLIDPGRLVPQLPPALSGNTAGRAMIEVASISRAIPKDKLSKSIIPTALYPKESNAVLHIPEEQTAHIRGQSEATTAVAPLEGEFDECSWFECWYSTRRPDLEGQGRWLSVSEAACNLAWALAWKAPSPVPGRIVIPDTHPQGISEQSATYDHPPISPTTAERLGEALRNIISQGEESIEQLLSGIQNVDQIISRLFNRSPDARTKKAECPIQPADLQPLSEAAWEEASRSYSKFNKHTDGYGKKAFDLLEKKTNKPLSPSVTETGCAEVYTKVLKNTWQRNWETTWINVMTDTMNGLEQLKKRVHSNPESATRTSDICESEAYKNLQEYMQGELCLGKAETHRFICSAFKALNFLRKVLEHSVPICYQRVMIIRYFQDRACQFSTTNPGPKIREIAKAIQEQDREERISHLELQAKIQKMATSNRTPKLIFPDGYDPIGKLEQIWRTATLVVTDDKFMDAQDSSPRPAINEQKEYTPQAKQKGSIWAQGQWKKVARAVLPPNRSRALRK